MTKLSDTQLIILASAAKRDDGGVVLPDRLVGAAREAVADRLLALGLIEAIEPTSDAPRPLRCEEPQITLRITDAGLAAIGIDRTDGACVEESAEDGAFEAAGVVEGQTETADPSNVSSPVSETTGPSSAPVQQRVPQRAPKLPIVLDLLNRPEGVSLDELVAATGWQRHSVRGVVAGTVKKKLGLAVVSEKRDGIRRYRIEA